MPGARAGLPLTDAEEDMIERIGGMDGDAEMDVLIHKMFLSDKWNPAPCWAQARTHAPARAHEYTAQAQ